jgi:hypothetical protein
VGFVSRNLRSVFERVFDDACVDVQGDLVSGIAVVRDVLERLLERVEEPAF